MRRLLAALQFLTVLPIGGETATPSRAAVFFPAVGALLGLSASAVFYGGNTMFGASIGALLTIVWLAAITGCLHEDGLADVADAFRAGRSQEKILLILKDSRIGTYGAVALVLSLLVRWQALAAGPHPRYGLVAVLALSRTAMVVLAAIAPAAGEGLGREFVTGISGGAAVVAIGQGVLIALVAGWREAVVLLFATTVVVLLARTYFLRRLGGVNGDCLGAACQMVETVNLLVLTWR